MAISHNMTPLKITEHPAEYIRSIMPEGSRKRKRSVRTTPSEEQMENYDMESVRAIRSNDIDTLRILLEEGKSFDACNRNGESILHLACRRGNLETVRFLLLEAGVDANVQDDMGRTALHDVCWRPTPNTDMMALLIRAVSPELLLAEDIRGHCCFDYCRQADWGQWMTFLHETSPVIKRRAALVQSITSSLE
jgi:hypothetical protein